MENNILSQIKEKAINGTGISQAEALEIAKLEEKDLFSLLNITNEIREHHKGRDINLCSIVNAKSGLCKEDCSFCSQSVHYATGIEEFPLLSATDIQDSAIKAKESGATEFSIVTSGTTVSKEKDIETVGLAASLINEEGMESCASLGIMNKENLLTLKEKGLKSYHHNLETSRSFFPRVCTTHEYDDDVNTVKRAKELGFYVCSGGIFGLGESFEQRIEMAETLKELDVDSIPLNFLNPRPGTPLETSNNLTPFECIKIIAIFRLILPTKDIIVCGGRELNLRDMQTLIFAAGANGTMAGNYLTTKGRSSELDLQMIKDLGLKPASGHGH